MNIPIQLVYVPPTKKPGKRRAFFLTAAAIFLLTGCAAVMIHGGVYAITF